MKTYGKIYLRFWITLNLLLVSFEDSFACSSCVRGDWGPWDGDCICGIPGCIRLRTRCTSCDSPGNYYCSSCVDREYCQSVCKIKDSLTNQQSVANAVIVIMETVVITVSMFHFFLNLVFFNKSCGISNWGVAYRP